MYSDLCLPLQAFILNWIRLYIQVNALCENGWHTANSPVLCLAWARSVNC